ncbi:MAG: thioredoxin [Lachnospira sp.]|nr:thioredoxin [Lachnospira sp.]MDD5828678.1 thioredoxin [Lachnospira sp.]
MAVLHVSKDDFEQEVLKADKPVLVDFWATWCGPCQMLGPIIEEVAKETDAVKVCKVNTDENPELAQKYRVMSIPTLLLFKNGEVAAQSIGFINKAEVKEFMEQ